MVPTLSDADSEGADDGTEVVAWDHKKMVVDSHAGRMAKSCGTRVPNRQCRDERRQGDCVGREREDDSGGEQSRSRRYTIARTDLKPDSP